MYAELDDAIAAKGPTCWSSGKCCKFDAFGHRLYVTGLEIAWFLGVVEGRQVEGQRVEGRRSKVEGGADGRGFRLSQYAGSSDPRLAEGAIPGACPYQVEGLCSTHAIRPLGCRIFFCQQGTQSWQQDLYEAFLKRLRSLHETHGLEYRYMDWMAGLSEATRAMPTGGR